MFNFNHLTVASAYANLSDKSRLYKYCWHFMLSIKQAIFLLALSVFSVVHAVFPFAFDFLLLKWRIDELKNLKESLPNDPELNKVEFK